MCVCVCARDDDDGRSNEEGGGARRRGSAGRGPGTGGPSADHLRHQSVLLVHVDVAPSPDVRPRRRSRRRLGAVARPPGPAFHQRRVGRLQVVREPQPRAPVDERRAEVEPVVAQLGRLVVPRERVVVVVPALAERQQRDRRVLRGRDVPAKERRMRDTYIYIYRDIDGEIRNPPTRTRAGVET